MHDNEKLLIIANKLNHATYLIFPCITLFPYITNETPVMLANVMSRTFLYSFSLSYQYIIEHNELIKSNWYNGF